jgi:hypothetical protein
MNPISTVVRFFGCVQRLVSSWISHSFYEPLHADEILRGKRGRPVLFEIKNLPCALKRCAISAKSAISRFGAPRRICEFLAACVKNDRTGEIRSLYVLLETRKADLF